MNKEQCNDQLKNIVTAEGFAGIDQRLESDNPSFIARARWRNFDRLDTTGRELLRVQFELCPLYQAGSPLDNSSLIKEATDETSIIESRVGKKWLAAKAAAQKLAEVCLSQGRQLELDFTFADIGILAEIDEEVSHQTIFEQARLYERLVNDIAHHLAVTAHFGLLSQIPPRFLRVPMVIRPQKQRQKVNDPDMDQLMAAIGLPEEFLPRQKVKRKADSLLKLWRLVGGDSILFRGLVQTYISYDTTGGADIHVAIERSDPLLSIQTMVPGDNRQTIPTLNILVK